MDLLSPENKGFVFGGKQNMINAYFFIFLSLTYSDHSVGEHLTYLFDREYSHPENQEDYFEYFNVRITI